MKSLELLARTLSPDGSAIKLTRRGNEYFILIDNAILMSSRMHGSEDALATLACETIRTLPRPEILIGGLGMGFTLRASLDLLPSGANILVAELLPAVIEWNRGPLGPLAHHPLHDQRVRVETADVSAILRARAQKFDAILLDVDNGPAAFTDSQNAALYSAAGIAATHASLKNAGVLAIWSAKEDRQFTQRLRQAGFNVRVRQARGRSQKGGPRHTIYVAQKR